MRSLRPMFVIVGAGNKAMSIGYSRVDARRTYIIRYMVILLGNGRLSLTTDEYRELFS